MQVRPNFSGFDPETSIFPSKMQLFCTKYRFFCIICLQYCKICAIIPPSTARSGATQRTSNRHTIMTDTQKDQLVAAIADLIRNSSEGDRIWDKSFAVFFNIEDGSIRCDHDLHIHEDERDILRADHVINYVGREAETEAWAAANPDEAADQYVQQFYWDIDEVMDSVAADND